MNNLALRPVGQTYALSVTNSSHAAVTIGVFSNDQVNQAAFLNTGANPVAVTLAPIIQGVGSAPATVLPVDGTPQGAPGTVVFVLPALMLEPVAYIVPTAPFSMTAIGSAAGPAIVYVQPIGDQS